MNEVSTCGCGGGGGGCGGSGGGSGGSSSGSGGAGASARRWHEADGEHIDVRGLAAPTPMTAILQLLEEKAAAPGTVTAHIDRDPLMLYPELELRGWRGRLLPQAPGEAVRLRLERAGAAA